jgi:guanylate kinase
MQQKPGKLLIFSAPSGSGKTTIVKHLIQTIDGLTFSVSATSRAIRTGEQDGKDYFFISRDEFKKRIANDEFLEWEEVYSGSYYGTLKNEVDKLLKQGKHVLFDVDVLGGINIKNQYKQQALAVFVKAPSIEVLRERLQNRSTDSAEQIQNRVEKAGFEMTYADKFDYILTNNDLTTAQKEITAIVLNFINA